MRAQIRSWESDFLSEVVTTCNCAENGVLPAKHFRCSCEIAALYSLPNGGAADHFAVYCHRRNPDHAEIKLRAKFFQKIKISAPIFSERPFVADTDFA